MKFAWEHLQSKILDWLLPLIGVPLLGLAIIARDWLTEQIRLQQPQVLLWMIIVLSTICGLLASLLILKRTKYIEYRGAFFKSKSDGSFHEAVYCGSCKSPTAIDSRAQFFDLQFKCKCGWVSSFNLGEFNVFFHTLKS